MIVPIRRGRVRRAESQNAQSACQWVEFESPLCRSRAADSEAESESLFRSASG